MMEEDSEKYRKIKDTGKKFSLISLPRAKAINIVAYLCPFFFLCSFLSVSKKANYYSANWI